MRPPLAISFSVSWSTWPQLYHSPAGCPRGHMYHVLRALHSCVSPCTICRGLSIVPNPEEELGEADGPTWCYRGRGWDPDLCGLLGPYPWAERKRVMTPGKGSDLGSKHSCWPFPCSTPGGSPLRKAPHWGRGRGAWAICCLVGCVCRWKQVPQPVTHTGAPPRGPQAAPKPLP